MPTANKTWSAQREMDSWTGRQRERGKIGRQADGQSGQTADSAILFALSNEKSLRKTLTMNPDDKRECTKEPEREGERKRESGYDVCVSVWELKLATWLPPNVG